MEDRVTLSLQAQMNFELFRYNWFYATSFCKLCGGIIILIGTSESGANESIKISIRFLTNEVRSDAIDIKVFYKKCSQYENCSISERTGKLVSELKENS